MTELIPAIDIIDGKCVRLTEGDYGKVKVYDSSPVDVALQLADAGCSTLHLVDLDGAKASKPVNLDILRKIASSTPLKIEWGGGIKGKDSLLQVLDAGADRVVCGSYAATNTDAFSQWLSALGGDRLVLGADVRNGKICTHGWEKESQYTAAELIELFLPFGLNQAVCTEISRDGTLTGPAWDFYIALQREYGNQVCFTVSGGVSSMADIEEAARLGLPRIIVGKAFYEGRITLKEMSKWWQKE